MPRDEDTAKSTTAKSDRAGIHQGATVEGPFIREYGEFGQIYSSFPLFTVTVHDQLGCFITVFETHGKTTQLNGSQFGQV